MSNIFQHTCGYCGNRFPERRTLVKHERCHTGEKPYACDSCDFRCSSSSSLCQHKRRRHDPTESGRKHICEQCGKGFYTRDNLKVDTLKMISIDGVKFLLLVYLSLNYAHYYFLHIIGTHCNSLKREDVFMLYLWQRIEKRLMLPTAYGLCSWIKTYLWTLRKRFLLANRTETSSTWSSRNNVLENRVY